VVADLPLPDGQERVVQEARELFGGVDILVNSIGGGVAKPLPSVTPDDRAAGFAAATRSPINPLAVSERRRPGGSLDTARHRKIDSTSNSSFAPGYGLSAALARLRRREE
jgi:NAD(P)-dependent dehydrogenase (short-subunit alcohol dehydrogenase family)